MFEGNEAQNKAQNEAQNEAQNAMNGNGTSDARHTNHMEQNGTVTFF